MTNIAPSTFPASLIWNHKLCWSSPKDTKQHQVFSLPIKAVLNVHGLPFQNLLKLHFCRIPWLNAIHWTSTSSTQIKEKSFPKSNFTINLRSDVCNDSDTTKIFARQKNLNERQKILKTLIEFNSKKYWITKWPSSCKIVWNLSSVDDPNAVCPLT